MRAALRPPLDLDLGIREEWLQPATEPAEVRGAGRDDVRLLVQDRSTGAFAHRRFEDLAAQLRPGDLLVVNRSGTLPASLPARTAGAAALRLHVAQRLGRGVYRVEVRTADGLHPSQDIPAAGERLLLWDAKGGTLGLRVLGQAHPASRQLLVRTAGRRSLYPWMLRAGRPIRYGYVVREWPLSAYQTIFAGPLGSAEMPSAARPFTPATLRTLRERGVGIAFLTLHCGLSSEEVDGPLAAHYLPAEPYVLPAATVRAIERARERGGRVIAVGTTVVRTLQSACAEGAPRPGRGLAGAVLHPGVHTCAVDGLLTGLHAPRTSHLGLLEAFLPAHALREAYLDAIREGYLWHEFGDMHLILPGARLGAICYSEGQE